MKREQCTNDIDHLDLVAHPTSAPSVETDPDVDVFHEAEAIQTCMKFLLGSVEELGLVETADQLRRAVFAVDCDLNRFCN